MKLLVDSCVFIASFDKRSQHRATAIQLFDELAKRQIVITMPAHGWFEVQCTLQRLSSLDKSFSGPTIAGKMNYLLELLHIDKPFIQKYSMAPIPYIKAADHIFLAVAKLNNVPLITTDNKMLSIASQCGVNALPPADFLAKIDQLNL
ncbi:MAG: PIN domain-containing protein [Elusimicrobiota bacterium]|nr:MAG: PIN domain-containing protein [Elusimicrobiota bacterium]